MEDAKIPSTYRIRYEIAGLPKISIVIPNMDHVVTLRTCIDSILTKTTYKNYEIIIVENNSVEQDTFAYYEELKNKSVPLISINVAITIIVVLAQKYIHAVTVGFAVCWMIFLLISLLVECFPDFFCTISPVIISAAGITYPVFLVHHKLISLLAGSFDLSYFPYRYVVTLFIIYFVLAVVIAKLLKRTTEETIRIIKHIKSFLLTTAV